MCGIAGFISARARYDEHSLSMLAARLTHRGPDDSGQCLALGVGLVQTRLSIIDLETGHQPIVSEDERLALVANGEIYNHVELRRTLEQAGHRFQTRSDSECILHAYREYGSDLLHALDGMFAFALHDRERGLVLLARDRLGIKPLFVSERDGDLLFASEPKALLALLSGEPELDEQVLAEILQANFASGRRSVYAGIDRLLPGEALLVDGEGKRKRWRYWQPRPATTTISSEREAGEQFDPLMQRVIDEHLRSDVPIGLFLSGGTDSGSLLALMHEAGYGPVHTFSVGFESATLASELDTAAAVAKRFDAPHTPLALARDEVLSLLPLAMWSADELMLDYASLPTLALAERAADELKVVFTGEGGDEVFAGYGRYRTRWPQRLAASLRGRALQGFRARGSFRTREERGVLSPQLASVRWQRPLVEAFRDLRGELAGDGPRDRPDPVSRLTRLQQLDIGTWLADDLLVKADRMLMAFGLEGRVPYLDHRVVEFGLSLSDGLKVRGRTGKWFLKRWMRRLLPEQQLFARKAGFTVPLAEWMDDAFLTRLGELLPRQRVIERYCRPQGVAALIARQRERGDATRAVWALLSLAVWHRIVIEDAAARPPSRLDPLLLLEG